MPRRPLGRGTQLSPWVWSAQDYLDRKITITVTFNDSTGALSGATIVREAGCLYGHLYFGTGPDGSPNTAPGTFTVAVGTTPISAAQLAAGGFNVVEDLLQLQVTAGP